MLLVGGPIAVRALPVDDVDVTAADLLASTGLDHPYSGYVETDGTLQLPVADRFSDVGRCSASATRMRVWWRDDDDWRVDQLLVTGETDLVHDGSGPPGWGYEQTDATLSRDPDIRLPRTADLLPPELAELLLADVDAPTT